MKLLVTILEAVRLDRFTFFSSPARYRQVAIPSVFNYVPETWQLA